MTTWPVLTEAAYLLQPRKGGIELLANDVARGVFLIAPLDAAAFGWMAAFMVKYRDCGADLADASLMWIGEHHGIRDIFTLDRRGFSVYRFTDGGAPEILPT